MQQPSIWTAAGPALVLYIKQLVCAHLEVDGSLVGQVGLVARQSDDYIRTSLSLELLYPVLCTCERLLHRENDQVCAEKL